MLKAVVGDRRAMVPDVVVDELRMSAARDERVRAVLEAQWIEHRELRSAAEILAFGRYAALLVKGNRNRGEAGVLALAESIGGIAVIDDAAGRRAAGDNGVPLRPTLALLIEAIRDDLLTVKLVAHLADDLLIGSYRLPFGVGGFEQWAADQGLS